MDEPRTPLTDVGGHVASREGAAQTGKQSCEGTVPEAPRLGVRHQSATTALLAATVGEEFLVTQASVSVALPAATATEVSGDLLGAHASHNLTRTVDVIWCRQCGRHVAVRLGVLLQRPCVGVAVGAYPARIERLKNRRHLVFAVSLDDHG